MRPRPRAILYLMAALTVAACHQPMASRQAQTAAPPPRPEALFRPEALGLLEDPDRDEWQQPDRIMDELHIADGSHVADVGAGGGWFTTRLARRVGPNGVVFAEDVQKQMVEAIEQRAHQEGLANIRPILSSTTDPMLPTGLDAVLIVDAYGQLAHPLAVLQHIAAALGPHGRLGIVDFKPESGGGPGPPAEFRIGPDRIVADAKQAALVLQSQATSLRYQYVLIFGR
jgi:ubiquinone/menaquinone biosynthesis C-methylase UbiE